MQHLTERSLFLCVMWGHCPPRWGGAEFLCDSQGGASFWEWQQELRHRGPEEAAVKQRAGKQVAKLWPDFIELIHGYDVTVVQKLAFLSVVVWASCVHMCVWTLVCLGSVLCCILHPAPTHTHTGPCRGLCIIFLSPVRFYKSPSLSEAIWGSILCIGLHYEHFTNMNLLSPHKILKAGIIIIPILLMKTLRQRGVKLLA